MSELADPKRAAIEQWTADPCGASSAEGSLGTADYFQRLLAARAEYAPWMDEALGYEDTGGLEVLDVGCGQGIDLCRYLRAGATATGIDLTPRHVELSRAHLAALGLEARIVEGDAENMPFPDASFDRVSSNGVLHHTPDILAALREIHRVLRPGGEARIIVYNRNSFHYWLSQVLYSGLLRGALFRERSMRGVLSSGVEYSTIGARPLVEVYTRSAISDLLDRAGFVGVTVSARHFRLVDTPITYPLRRIRRLADADFLDRLGRIGGWYLVASGVKPRAPRG